MGLSMRGSISRSHNQSPVVIGAEVIPWSNLANHKSGSKLLRTRPKTEGHLRSPLSRHVFTDFSRTLCQIVNFLDFSRARSVILIFTDFSRLPGPLGALLIPKKIRNEI